jgi:hypothetical protein
MVILDNDWGVEVNVIHSFVILAAFSGNAFAGQHYDACLQQEQTLRSKEAGRCSGLQYLFNPSDCFVTRKALKEFNDGKCVKIGRAENAIKVPVASKLTSETVPAVSGVKNEVPIQPEVKVAQDLTERIITTVPANPELDACRKQEKELNAKETDQCSGIKYTFNPSGCFSARRMLKEFNEGKCRKTAVEDKEFLQEKSKRILPAAKPASVIINSTVTVQPATKASIADTEPKQTGETEKLREENARVKAENERLRVEMEQLRRKINK